MAEESTAIQENPSLEKDEAEKLALWLKPIRWGLCNGHRVNSYTGHMFLAWMGSHMSRYWNFVVGCVPKLKS